MQNHLKENTMTTTIKTILASRLGFTIIGRGFAKRHHCFTRREALAWASCYDDGATIYKGGVAVASKCIVKAPTVATGI